MTEGITVAIRFGEGEDQVVARYRDLYRIPAFLQHPAFIEGAWGYIRDYALAPSPFEGHEGCAPQDVGLVAIDLPSRQILTYEDRGFVYSDPHTILDAHRGNGPRLSAWETRAAWKTLMAEGRVSMKVQWQRRVPSEWDAEGASVTDGPYVMGVGPYPGPNQRSLSVFRLPYSIEPLRDLDAAVERILHLKACERRGKRVAWVELEPFPQIVSIDLSPWVIHRFPLTRTGDEQLRRRMAKLGFPGCGPRDPAWLRWSRQVRRQPRDWAGQRSRRRAEAMAPLVTSPF